MDYVEEYGEFDDDYEETYSILFDDIVTETEKAWLIDIDGDEIWFPKSVCEVIDDSIVMPYWLAEKKELI